MFVTKQGQGKNKSAVTIGFWAAFLTMMTCLHAWTGEEKHTWSLLAVVFAVVYATLLSANYYMQMTIVQHHLVNGSTDGLSLWLYAYHYPYNIPGALEAVGYGFLSVSFLCAAQVFGRGKFRHWVRWTFVGTGLTSLVLPIDPLFRLSLVPELIDGVAYALLGILAPVLPALLFQRSKDTERPGEPPVVQGEGGMIHVY